MSTMRQQVQSSVRKEVASDIRQARDAGVYRGAIINRLDESGSRNEGVRDGDVRQIMDEELNAIVKMIEDRDQSGGGGGA